MYITGTNCNGEYIVLLDKDELNRLIKHIKDDAFHEGVWESARIENEEESKKIWRQTWSDD